MAVDEAILIDAADNGIATLRFYGWSEPTLSLGYFQTYDARQFHAASRECAIVRRQTGGGAILHDRELTYSLALPAAHPLARNALCLYQCVHEALIATLQPLLDAQSPGWTLRVRAEASDLQCETEFLCFKRRAPGDVVLARPSSDHELSQSTTAHDSITADWKVLGSAQRRQRGALLQHGSLLLETSAMAPELKGISSLTRVNIPIDLITCELSAQLSSSIGLLLKTKSATKELKRVADRLVSQKYDSPDWTRRR
jgi:lipoyl(octanoyl) transferase